MKGKKFKYALVALIICISSLAMSPSKGEPMTMAGVAAGTAAVAGYIYILKEAWAFGEWLGSNIGA